MNQQILLDVAAMNRLIDNMYRDNRDLINSFNKYQYALDDINSKVGGYFGDELKDMSERINNVIEGTDKKVNQYINTLKTIIDERLAREEEASSNLASSVNTTAPSEAPLPPAPPAVDPNVNNESQTPPPAEPVNKEAVDPLSELDSLDSGMIDTSTMDNFLPSESVTPQIDPGFIAVTNAPKGGIPNVAKAGGIGLALGGSVLGASAITQNKDREEDKDNSQELDTDYSSILE